VCIYVLVVGGYVCVYVCASNVGVC
jgi:hypothetical protein